MSGRRLRWSLAVLAAVATVGLVGYKALNATETAAGSTVTYTGYSGTALIGVDQRTITVGGFVGPCFGTVDAEAEESSNSVALRLRWTAPNHHGVCDAATGLVGAIDAHLVAPLGGRALVDDETGRPLPRFDANTLLHPLWLPAGYTSFGLQVGVLTTWTSGKRAVGCIQFFHSEDGGALAMVQMLGQITPTPATHETNPIAVMVRGHPGHADSRSITWTEDGQTVYMLISSDGNAGPPVTIADLVAIAGSA